MKPEHRSPDFDKRWKAWCKRLSSTKDLNLENMSGHCLQTKFLPADRSIRLYDCEFLVIAAEDRHKPKHRSGVYYDIGLVRNCGNRPVEIDQQTVKLTCEDLYENGLITAKTFKATETNYFYAIGVYCFSEFDPGGSELAFINQTRVEPSISPMEVIASRKTTRRLTRASDIQALQAKYVAEQADEFHDD